MTSVSIPTARYRSASASALSAKSVRPESASAPRHAFWLASRVAIVLSSCGRGGHGAPLALGAENAEHGGPVSTVALRDRTSSRAKARVRRAEGGVGSGSARLSQTSARRSRARSRVPARVRRRRASGPTSSSAPWTWRAPRLCRLRLGRGGDRRGGLRARDALRGSRRRRRRRPALRPVPPRSRRGLPASRRLGRRGLRRRLAGGRNRAASGATSAACLGRSFRGGFGRGFSGGRRLRRCRRSAAAARGGFVARRPRAQRRRRGRASLPAGRRRLR